jgi:hypothetical protein
MPVTKKSIVVEHVLTDVFSYLPKMSFGNSSENYIVRFGFGDKVELDNFLSNREESNLYPLIWMLYPLDENHKKTSVELKDLTFLLATLTNRSMENKERLLENYGKILLPLLDNIRHCFKSANILTLLDEDNSFKIVKYPNYSYEDSRNEQGTIHIWDAIKLRVDLRIIDACLNPIKF